MNSSQIDLTALDRFRSGPPHEVYQYLRDEHPVFWHEPTQNTPDGEGFWCLTRYDDVAWAAREPELFSSDTGGGREGGGTLIEDLPRGLAAGVLLNMQDDPRHHHIRRLVTPAVSPKQLRVLEAELRTRSDAIVDQAIEMGSCDFVSQVAAELPLQAIASLLGVPQSDRGFLFEWAEATLDYEDHDLGQTSARMQSANVQMSAYCGQLLAAKRQTPGTDITSIFVNAELPEAACPGGRLSDIEQTMFFHLLVAAGSETTRNSITAGVLALAEAPELWERLRADVLVGGSVSALVEESLRWASSTIYNRRTATTAVQRHGQNINPGDKVVLWWQAANYDDRVFAEPERFDLDRAPNPHLAFGLGSHFCLGANLARLEMTILFEGLLRRVRRIEIDGDVVRSRSNKHAGFRQAPVRLLPG